MNWGAAGEAIKYVQALHKIERLQLVNNTHVKTFRPQLLVLTGRPRDKQWLIKFVSLLQKGRGLMICGDIIMKDERMDEEKSDATDLRVHNETATELAHIYERVCARRLEGDNFLSDKQIWKTRCPGAFCEAVSADSLYDGFQRLLQTSGVGKMRPNTVVIGFKHNWRSSSESDIANYEKLIRTALASHVGLMIVRDDNGVLDINLRNSSPTLPKKMFCCLNKEHARVNVSSGFVFL